MEAMQFKPIADSSQMEDLKDSLMHCTGTEYYYQDMITKAHFTDGIHILREAANCFWLISDILIAGRQKKFRDIPFQLWILSVKDNQGILTMQEDSNTPVLYRQEYSYTDFPAGTFKLYFIDKILLLPNEY